MFSPHKDYTDNEDKEQWMFVQKVCTGDGFARCILPKSRYLSWAIKNDESSETAIAWLQKMLQNSFSKLMAQEICKYWNKLCYAEILNEGLLCCFSRHLRIVLTVFYCHPL